MVPFPGRPRPRASVTQFMELAVYIPEQEPHPGQAQSSRALSSFRAIRPTLTLPTPSKTLIRSTVFPSSLPASMGPPLTTMVGIFRRSAAISMPGMILSQLGIMTRASKGWAMTMTSTESAISSRLAREYFIPVWPMAIPSQIPMEGNSMGVPPAMRIPAFTSWVIILRWMCPGMISL